MNERIGVKKIIMRIAISCCHGPLFVVWSLFLVLSTTPISSSLPISGITFLATNSTNLEPTFIKEAIPLQDVSMLVKSTQIFRSLYETSPIQFSADKSPTQFIPNIVLVRGSSDLSTAHPQTDIFDRESSSSSPPLDLTASPYGLVGTIATAYAHHHNLELRPDDIWIAVITQFSAYVNARSEQLRDKFVDFEGKRNLEIKVAGSVRTLDWSIIPPTFLDLIAQNVKNATLREWFLPGFSTTTPNDVVAASAAAMCTLQDFFTYKVSFTCGIPQITLLGDVTDWQLLRVKVDLLAQYDDGTGIIKDIWLPLLQEILDNFVDSAMHGSENNLDFWHQILHASAIPYGGISTLSGWLTAFTFFDKEGQQLVQFPKAGESSSSLSSPFEIPLDIGSRWGTVDPDDVNPNIITCPITIDELGKPYNSTLFVGQMSYEQVPDEKASVNNTALEANSRKDVMLIKPRNDWAIVFSDGFVEQERPRFAPQSPKLPICLDYSALFSLANDPLFETSDATSSPTISPRTNAPEAKQQSPICFSGNSLVHVQNKGLLPIHQLKLGDYVLSSADGMKYSRVYSFGHLHRSRPAEFLQIHYTTRNKHPSFHNNPLEISKDHLLFVNGVMAPASTVRVGDVLINISPYNAETTNVIVSKIRLVQREGVYAPFTESGTLVVNGVLASNYITHQKDSAVLTLWGGYNTGWTMHGLSHGYQTIHRLACSIHWSWCAEETHHAETGISNWLVVPFGIVDGMFRFPRWMASFISLLMMAIVLLTTLRVVAVKTNK